MASITIKIDDKVDPTSLNRIRTQICKNLKQNGVHVIMSYTDVCHYDTEASQVDMTTPVVSGGVDMTTPGISA